MSIRNDNILSNNLVYLPETAISDSRPPQVVSSSNLINAILPNPAPSSTEQYVPFAVKKSNVSLVDSNGLIVGKVDGAVACRYVPLSTHGTGQVQIHDIILNVCTCYGDGPNALWEEVCRECKHNPCLLFDYAGCIEEIGVHLHKRGKSNCKICYYLYHKMVKFIFGDHGYRNRCKLPNCIVVCIQAAFPNKNPGEPYVGFCNIDG